MLILKVVFDGHCKFNNLGFSEVKEIAGAITPVPGGVGPMTVTMLMSNTFLAARWRTLN